ncbi:MAG: bifunctional isocitrate dehydrogenase kinase/phosphatase [Gammaproteobacteria bacterium]
MAFQQTTTGLCAQHIYDGFSRYNKKFKKITTRAKRRFEKRNWDGQMQDIKGRVELYEEWVQRVENELRSVLGEKVNDHQLWVQIRDYFGSRLEGVPDAGFMKTFFNTITRRIFGTVGADSAIEFVAPPPEEGMATLESLSMRRYPCWGDVHGTFRRVLKDFRFKVPYIDLDGDAAFMEEEVRRFASGHLNRHDACLRFEFIDSTFFQGSRAYLVGRILHPDKISPIVVAFENLDAGIRVDAVLMDEKPVSVVFSYTRSYYFADPTSVVASVYFLHSILPTKPIDELYTVMGRLRQGKTERYRKFVEHLEVTDDQFVHADGDAGLVMIVFTLPSFNLVFKVLRDKFGFPKTTTHAQVHEKYKLVSNHDHAGRLIDTQFFRNLALPRDRFSPELLAELEAQAENTISLSGDWLVFNEVYVERRVRPLNLYIRESSRERAQAAILDYGQAIKELAETNIFPGDLLLKNFGLTSSGRVIFYDYDEVELVSDCFFKEIPEPSEDEFDMMDTGMTQYVGPRDIFPEEFMKFLAMDKDLRDVFLKVHGEILTAEYWRDVKARRVAGKITPVVPYHRATLGVNHRSRSKL